MVNYQKYMFDNFVIKNDNENNVPDNNEEALIDNFEHDSDIESSEVDVGNIEDFPTTDNEVPEDKHPEDMKSEDVDEEVVEFQPYDYVKETEVEENIITYTEEELRESLAQAEKVAYNKGLEEAKNSSIEKQNILLEDIKNQLMTIFASLEEKKSDTEISTLNFAVSLVRKILPTLEKETADKEVKKFLSDNFSSFASQESLSFSFNPEVISQVADSIGRLAEQNDFEGKIAIHKDASLGLSDCKVEWKSGGVERKTSSMLNKIENLININKQERENG